MAEDSSSGMCLDDFTLWRVPVLKDYLRKRGLKTSSMRKDELVALAYGAHVMKAPILPSAAETLLTKAQQYKSLLLYENDYLPDPLCDLNGWYNEENGMELWPPTMQFDIAEYLLERQENKDLGKRLMSDYKEGKAFSYFDCNYLKTILYHPITIESKVCFLKSESTPSQNIGHPPHKIWILLNKENGKVQQAYFTCFAG